MVGTLQNKRFQKAVPARHLSFCLFSTTWMDVWMGKFGNYGSTALRGLMDVN